MSHLRALRTSTSVLAHSSSDVMSPNELKGSTDLSNYDDEVTQADIDRLHAHVAEHFGCPGELTLVGEPAW